MGGDPVAAGLVANFNRPGGSVPGQSHGRGSGFCASSRPASPRSEFRTPETMS